MVQACSPYEKWPSLEVALDSQGVLTLKNASFRVRQVALYHLLAGYSWASCLTSLNTFPHPLNGIINSTT